jgi:hypothetical protein
MSDSHQEPDPDARAEPAVTRRDLLMTAALSATGMMAGGALLRASAAYSVPEPPLHRMDHLTTGTNCRSGLRPHTKGRWSEITPRTPRAYAGFFVMVECDSDDDFLVDLGVGPAGRETPVIADMLLSGSRTNLPHLPFYVPLKLPAGSRVVTRCQASGPLGLARIERLYGMPPHPIWPGGVDKVVTLGANASRSGGTAIDPGDQAETRGAWVEFSPGLPIHTYAVVIMAGDRAGALPTGRWTIDIGVGRPGQERMVIRDWLIRNGGASTGLRGQGLLAVPVDIPPRTRIVGRCISNRTESPERLIDVVLLAIG